ncbi:hypothetical protein EGR52_07735 [bacterium]|nr:hypothetical protein [bacterium]
MENAADALKMAGAVLLFVLAISVAIVSFGQARETADTILDYKDRETVYIDGNLYYQATGTERTVGLETIIPTIYRAYIENYKIVFEGLNAPIYTLKLSGNTDIKKYTIDLETKATTDGIQINNVALANDEQKSEFLCGILYRDFTKSGTQDKFEKKYNVELPKDDISLISRLKGTKITEYLGVYYQNDNENVPDVNKTEKRIITYKIENQ